MASMSQWVHRLMAISPIDGRYRKDTEELAPFVSEFGLIKYRLMVEVEYLIALAAHPQTTLDAFSASNKRWLRGLYFNFTLKQAEIVKRIETEGFKEIKKTNHDVNALVRFMILRMNASKELRRHVSWVHFALTSEDINNIAYGLMLSDVLGKFTLPLMDQVQNEVMALANQYKDVPTLARSHGQPASPTTLGKEFNVFASRLERQLQLIRIRPILLKLNGATGNYNAHVVAFPSINWIEFSADFIDSLSVGRQVGFKPNFVTTQIEPHDTLAELFDNLKRIHSIFVDFCQDMWRYISDEWIVQKAVAGEDGSSAMPQKINPIQFENAEGNAQLTVSLCEFFARTLPVSRLQRHLSDSTIERNFGVALSHAGLTCKSVLKGLHRATPNPVKLVEDLERRPEVISEAIQIILRREGIPNAYDQLKELTRGKPITMKDFHAFIRKLKVKPAVKKELLAITPTNYIGIAAILATRR